MLSRLVSRGCLHSSKLSGSASAALIARSSPLFVAQKTIQTYAPAAAMAKTPIQHWGWDYLHKQKGLKRPLSPHLTVYKPMLTWMVSGMHRITGCAMAVAGCLLAGGLMVLPFDFTAVINYIASFNLPEVVKSAVRFVVALPIIFHTLNGVRFLAFDLAKGTDIKSVYKTGWSVVALSFLLATVVTLMPYLTE